METCVHVYGEVCFRDLLRKLLEISRMLNVLRTI